MTFNVYYTDRATLDSSFVNRAWYDNTRNRLALELNDVVYEYYDVQKATYDDLVSAPSAGNFYRNNIQGSRHANRLGYAWQVNEVAKDNVPQPGAYTPQEVRFHNGGGYIRSNGEAYFPVVAGEKVIASGVSGGITVTDPTKIQKFSLAAKAEVVPQVFDYTLQFTVVDEDGEEGSERSHTLKGASLDDAIEQMLSLADKLDQDIRLKGASVRFE